MESVNMDNKKVKPKHF